MEQTPPSTTRPLLITFVGMPGAGKTEAVRYIQKNNAIPSVRFGDLTEEGLKEKGLPVTTETEREFREAYRREHGMEAYARNSRSKIDQLLQSQMVIVIDGLYSWEEYTSLKEIYEGLVLIHVYAESKIRYARLSARPIRPLTLVDARQRDISEIEKLNKGGPIAIADYLLVNNGEVSQLYKKIDTLLQRLGVKIE